jgi:hypothetical protein
LKKCRPRGRYCPDQLSNNINNSGFSVAQDEAIEKMAFELQDADAMKRAKARIMAQSSMRFEQARESCKSDLLNRNLRAAINRVIDMYRLDESTVRALSLATKAPIESFSAWRLLRRSDVELLLRAAENVGDSLAVLLGQKLLQEVSSAP